MSYIKKLDILLEAESPSRRDFNKSVAAAAVSGNALPSADLMSGAVSAGAKVAGGTMPKLAAVLNAAFSKTSPYYRLLNSVGPKKIKEVYDLLIQNKDLSVSQLAKSEPAAKLFKKTMGDNSGHVYFDSDIAKHLDNNEGYWRGRDIGQTWTFCVNNDLPKGLLGMRFDEPDIEIFSQIDNMISAKPAVIQEVSKAFGGFDKYLTYIFDNVASSGYDDRININNILVRAKENQPALFKTLGLKADPSDFFRLLRSSLGKTRFHDENAAKAFSSNLDIMKELRDKGILSDKYDGMIAEITGQATKYRRLANYKAGQEFNRENRKRVKNFDDDAIGRWEDEGGALGPLDEAIRRLLNVIY